jgi:hypothetical protein
VTLDDNPAGIVNFVIWYRLALPREVDLYLSDDSSGVEIKIMHSMNANDLLDILNKL